MKIEIKKLDDTKREISVEVSSEVVQKKFEEVFNRIAKEAKVAGFRPGHAPRDIIEKRFSSQAEELVLKELIPDTYNKVIEQESLDAITLPEITDVRLERASFSFKAKIEVSPLLRVEGYKGLEVDYKKVTVTSDDIKRSIDSLKESRKIDSVDENFARGLGYPSVEELERAVERQLYIQREHQQRQQIEAGLIEAISKEQNFKPPESLLKSELGNLLRQEKLDLALKGTPREKIEEQEKSLIQELGPIALKRVKVYLLLAEIAKKENIPVDDDMPAKVMEFLLRNAQWIEAS